MSTSTVSALNRSDHTYDPVALRPPSGPSGSEQAERVDLQAYAADRVTLSDGAVNDGAQRVEQAYREALAAARANQSGADFTSAETQRVSELAALQFGSDGVDRASAELAGSEAQEIRDLTSGQAPIEYRDSATLQQAVQGSAFS
jgi:hypothetical protein